MKKHFIIFIFSLSLVTYGLSLSPQVVQAVGPLLSDSLIKDAECSDDSCTLNTFIALGVSLSNIILGLVGALTLAMFIYGGVILLISGGNTEKISKGKEIILGSVVGLLIVFGSYTIIKFVVNDVFNATQKFTGTTPGGTAGGENGDAKVCGGSSTLENCIESIRTCVDRYGREGQTIDKKCNIVGNYCCKFQPAPDSKDTCEGSGNASTGLRTCEVLMCPSGSTLVSGSYLCPTLRPLCCEGPPS